MNTESNTDKAGGLWSVDPAEREAAQPQGNKAQPADLDEMTKAISESEKLSPARKILWDRSPDGSIANEGTITVDWKLEAHIKRDQAMRLKAHAEKLAEALRGMLWAYAPKAENTVKCAGLEALQSDVRRAMQALAAWDRGIEDNRKKPHTRRCNNEARIED